MYIFNFILHKAISYCNIIHSIPKGKTALQNASFKGNVECMKILIERGAEVNTKDNDDSTPMHKASLLQSSGMNLSPAYMIP